MKTIHTILFGLVLAASLALATPANAYEHGRYVYHRGHWGYYHGPRFYEYSAGPYPYYYGPFNPPGVAVTVVPRRHRFFFFF